MNKEHFTELIHKYISGSLTEQENTMLMQMFDAHSDSAELENILRESYQQTNSEHSWNDRERDIFYNRLVKRGGESGIFNNNGPIKPVGNVRYLHRKFFRYAAAILLFIGCAVAWYVISTKKGNDQDQITNNDNLPLDIAPGGEKAILILADGTKIVLDSAANGNLANQGGTEVLKLTNGQIAYNLKAFGDKEVMWNTMTTPKGGQYQLTLPDGTKAWLNASSSITFPNAFTESERRVKIMGEVYFEVTKNVQEPFIVAVDGRSSVEVLGTSFNINSYADEGVIKTTLIEGSVRIVNEADLAVKKSSVVLKPGQQAIVAAANQPNLPQSLKGIKLVSAPDLEQTLAWKNGIFDFNGADLPTVMKQLERWYNIDVQYKSSMPHIVFKGRMYRNVNLSDVLDMFKDMGVRFELEGKKLIVY